MVISMLVMILVMVVDRVLYTQEQHKNRKLINQKLRTD